MALIEDLRGILERAGLYGRDKLEAWVTLARTTHQTPDRVPIDLGGNQTGIHKLAYEPLVDHLGVKEEIVIMDLVQQLARPSEAVLEPSRELEFHGAVAFTCGTMCVVLTWSVVRSE